MKKTHFYWHRTVYALKKIPSFFRDWEETVSAHSTPDLICEAMEDHPHLVAKQLAFLMSAPASVFEKDQIWTHVFIKALELGQHDIADLADKHIPHKGWTALASLPFNSPALLKKYLPKNPQHPKDFKNVLFNLGLKYKALDCLTDNSNTHCDKKVTIKPLGVLREEIVSQISRYASSQGVILSTFMERIDCALESADYIIELAKNKDMRAIVILKSMEYGRFAAFEKVSKQASFYSAQIQKDLFESLPKLFSLAQTDIELKYMCNSLLSILKNSKFIIEEKVFTEVLQNIARNKFRNQVEEIDAVFENASPKLLDGALHHLSEKDRKRLSCCGVLTASLIQRHTLMGHTQDQVLSVQRRKM